MDISREPSRFPSGPLLVAGWLVIALSACGRVPGQFQVLNNQVPDENCVIGVDETVYRGSGRLDLSLVRDGARSAFLLHPLIENNLPAPTSGADVNAIFFKSFAVDIAPIGPVGEKTAAVFGAPENQAFLHYSIPWSGSIASGGGKAGASVAAFPVQLAAQLRNTQEYDLGSSAVVSIRIRVFGQTTTREIESDPFDYPVSICSGCLVANVRACPYTTAPLNLGNACNVAQDTPVDCCSNGGTLVCPPEVALQ